MGQDNNKIQESDIKLEDLKKQAEEFGLDINEVLKSTLNTLKLSQSNDNSSTPQREVNVETSTIDSEVQDKVWERVLLARHQDRPTTLEYVKQMSEQFMELHGDRYAGDDKAMVGGVCTLDGEHFTFIGTQKGANMKENIIRNYGMAHPEGYRKALRLAKQAEHFGRPILTFIDTTGAYPGLASEERGIGEAIARNLMEFSILETPIICVVIGEGGSGGALGIGVGDKIFMMENSVYSVISPEGFASILLRDAKRSKEAAVLMKMTAEDVLSAGFIDGIITESQGGAHVDFMTAAETIKTVVLNSYHELKNKDISQLLRARSQKIIDWTRESEAMSNNIPPAKDLLTRIREFFD